MGRYAVIKDGIVNNIVIWDGKSEWNPGPDHQVVCVEGILCSAGYTYECGEFKEAPPVGNEE